MRIIVLGFAVLACLKVWTQDRLYRTVMSDVLIQAYRERAQQVCQKEVTKPAKSPSTSWAAVPAAEIVIGNPHASVAIWDVDNPLWDVRYRHPHIVLTAAGNAKTTCAYDLVVGLVSFSTR